MQNLILNLLQQKQLNHTPVVLSKQEEIIPIDLSGNNKSFNETVFKDPGEFSAYIEEYLQKNKAKFAYGGYNELRDMYKRSTVFDSNGLEQEPRRLHLGVDVWGAAGTPVFAPLDGILHSTGNNDHFGDYGATIIIEHRVAQHVFYTLYGHCAAADLNKLQPNQKIKQGTIIGHFGKWEENGNWPPHLHLQLILDLQHFKGDYPGVCAEKENKFYLNNCPNATFFIFASTMDRNK